MKNEITPFMERLAKFVDKLSAMDGNMVVSDSKQIVGTTKDQMLSLKERLAPNNDIADTRKHLESLKTGESVPDSSELYEDMIQMWADDIINKHLDDLFKD